MNVDTPVNVMSLCSGIGGLDLGVQLAIPNARTVVYVEREAYCCEILLSRMDTKQLDAAPLWTDLKTFDGYPWRGKVDLIIGGYPCQPFSVAGKRRGAHDSRHLWNDVARTIGEVRPTAVFLENVPGHLSMGLRDVRSDLEAMGFSVEAGLFSAEEIGAPHRRERLFVLAYAASDGWQQRWTESGGREGGSSIIKCGGAISKTTFPPRPLDGEAWEHWHGPKPAIRRDPNGVPNRVDRLRACGNGVVPQQAAFALQTLMRQI